MGFLARLAEEARTVDARAFSLARQQSPISLQTTAAEAEF
jgi:hypothetical protein